MASARLLSDRTCHCHDSGNPDSASESDKEGQQIQIPTPTSLRTPPLEFIPQKTRDRLRELVLNSPNPRKSLNYFRSKFLFAFSRIDKTEPQQVIPVPDALLPCFNGERSPARVSRDDERCELQKLVSRVDTVVDSALVSTGSASSKRTLLEKAKALILMPVCPHADWKEATLNLQDISSMAAMYPFSASTDVGAEGVLANVQLGTTDVLHNGHTSVNSELPCRRGCHPPRDEGQSLRAVCYANMKHFIAMYGPFPAEGGAVGIENVLKDSNSVVSDMGVPSLPHPAVYVRTELLRALHEGIYRDNQPRRKIARVCNIQKWEACTGGLYKPSGTMAGAKSVQLLLKEKNAILDGLLQNYTTKIHSNLGLNVIVVDFHFQWRIVTPQKY